MGEGRMKPVKLVKLLANLGYGSRKDVTRMLRNGWVTRADGSEWAPDDQVDPAERNILVDDEPLDPPPGLILMLNKPVGYTCSTRDAGPLIYDLLPPRFRLRDPLLSCVGRLDRETSGMLLMTDDGALLHRIISPRAHLSKVYEVTHAEALRGNEAALFASGTMLLDTETEPLAPALLESIDTCHSRIILTEGRYHQVRRMFAATGNHVVALRRVATGGLSLGDLAEGQWRALDVADIERLFRHGSVGSEGEL